MNGGLLPRLYGAVKRRLRPPSPGLDLRVSSALAMGCARGALTAGLRDIDPSNPSTWEFSAFSQNGEDGLIDYLCRRLLTSNRYFVEIGASNGLENNSAYLAFARRYSGLMVEGDRRKSAWAKKNLQAMGFGVSYLSCYVNTETLGTVFDECTFLDPDLFSLDIDSIDFHVAAAMMDRSFRPKIVVVEYNSAFGPAQAVTVPYKPRSARKEDPTGLYYGVSVEGWRRFWSGRGYRFVTVDENGVNAVFVDPQYFDADFLSELRGLPFAENVSQKRRFRTGWEGQFDRVRHLPLEEVTCALSRA